MHVFEILQHAGNREVQHPWPMYPTLHECRLTKWKNLSPPSAPSYVDLGPWVTRLLETLRIILIVPYCLTNAVK